MSGWMLVAVYAYAMCSVFKKGDWKLKGASTLIVFMILSRGVAFQEPFAGDLKENVEKTKESIDNFLKESNINKNEVTKGPLDSVGGGKMGTPVKADSLNMSGYDGLCLKTGNDDYWMKSPDDAPLVPNDTLYTYLGSDGPVKMRLSDQAALRGPPVDGVEGSPEKMFMLANNVTSPLCCPSTFSTSTGCLCTTENQRDFVAARGTLNTGGSGREHEI